MKGAQNRVGSSGRGSSQSSWVDPRLIVLATLVLGAVLTAFAAQAPQPKPADQQGRQEGKDQAQAIPTSLPKGKKLVLKDGSFHLVRSYERKGDRVRYYSVERSAWEEIPTELVDWDATSKAEAEDAQRKQEAVEKIHAAQMAERAAELDVDASIELAPGLFLPPGEGLFVVEGRTIVPLEQSTAVIKLDKKRLLTQVLVPIPVVPTRHRVQLAGKRAKLRLTSSQPEFYMRTAEAREPEMELIRAEVKGDARQVEFVSTQITGQQSSQRKTISTQRWSVARGVYRYTLSQPLELGEYALAEILPEGMNLYLWDFGVDSQASGHPQNGPPLAPSKASGKGQQKQ